MPWYGGLAIILAGMKGDLATTRCVYGYLLDSFDFGDSLYSLGVVESKDSFVEIIVPP